MARKKTAEADVKTEEGNEREVTLEELFESLERTMERLEDPEIGLEESFAAYEQGMAFIKKANEKIDRVEKQVLVINERGELDEFPGEAGEQD